MVLDTLRKDYFDTYFDWLPGTRFDNAWSTGRWTIPAHASLFAGKHPRELGVHAENEQLDCPEYTLAEVLAHNGYKTRAFSCNTYASQVFDFDRGFNEFTGNWRIKHHSPDIFDWSKFLREHNDAGPERYLKALLGCVTGDCSTIPSLKHGVNIKMRDLGLGGMGNDDGASEAYRYVKDTEFGSDEFFFLNLMEAHSPFNPPEEYGTYNRSSHPSLIDIVRGETGDTESLEPAYDASVRYLSDIYRKIFDELREDFTYIITLSDHGELFGDGGMWSHMHGVHPNLTHIPLCIYSDAGMVDTTESPITLLDVHATVLDAAGVAGDSAGKSLLSTAGSGTALTEHHGLNKRTIESMRGAGIPEEVIEKYNASLRGIAIPDDYYGYETVNGFVETGDAAQVDPKKRMDEILNTLEIRDVSRETKLPEGIEQHLEALGYR